jgi:hypothetical protein
MQDTIWGVGGGGDESGRQRDAEILFNVQNIRFPRDSRGMLFFDRCCRGGLAIFRPLILCVWGYVCLCFSLCLSVRLCQHLDGVGEQESGKLCVTV